MKRITLPRFGEIELDYFDDGYTPYRYGYSIGGLYDDDGDDEFRYNGKPLELDVNFTDLSDANITMVTKTLNNLDTLVAKAEQVVENDFITGKTVKDYVKEWIDYHLKEEPFKGLVPEPFDEKTPKLLLDKLKIVRIGLYAFHDSEPFIVMDFAFGYEIDSGYRDDMVVLKMNADFELLEITTEG